MKQPKFKIGDCLIFWHKGGVFVDKSCGDMFIVTGVTEGRGEWEYTEKDGVGLAFEEELFKPE